MNKIVIEAKDIERMIFESVNSILNEDWFGQNNGAGLKNFQNFLNGGQNTNTGQNIVPPLAPTAQTTVNSNASNNANTQNNSTPGANQQNNNTKNNGKMNWQQKLIKAGEWADYAGDVAQKLANHDPAADVERLLNGGNPSNGNPNNLNAQQVQQCKKWIKDNYGNYPNYQKLLFNDPKDQNSPYGSLAKTNKQFANMVYKYAKEQYTRLSMGYK